MINQMREEQHLVTSALIIYTILSLLNQPINVGVTGPL